MSLLNTLMQELRSQYTDQYDKNELRESRYGALRFFQEEARERPIFDEETLNNIVRSYGNVVEVPVLDSQTVTVSTPYTRTCAVVDSENDSAIVSLTFASYGWAFSMTPATHYNNLVRMQQDFQRKMDKYLIQFSSDIDDLCITELENAKNQYWVDVAPDYYAQVGDALQVPQSEKNDFYNQLEAIMNTMDFYDTITVVAATKHMPLVRRLDNQGSSNATNEGFQFDLRSYRWSPTNRVTNGAGVESTGYAIENGSVFIGNRNDADTTMGFDIGHKIWDTETVPIANMEMGTFFQEDCADASALGGAATAGNTRSYKQGYEFSTDIVVSSTYNSDPANQYNPITKFEILV